MPAKTEISTSFPILLDRVERIDDEFTKYDGIMGLAPNDESSGPLFIDYLYRDDKIPQDKFSILPGNEDNTPLITFGGFQQEGDPSTFFNSSLN